MLQPSDLPCKVTYSIWSHAIFKTSAVAASIERLSPQMAADAGDVEWLGP